MKESKKSSSKKSKNLKKSSVRGKKVAQENIDYSDIPETDAKFWAEAEIQLPDKKEMITLRLDPDIIEFFKRSGKGYQTRMNSILKSYVNAHKHTFDDSNHSDGIV